MHASSCAAACPRLRRGAAHEIPPIVRARVLLRRRLKGRGLHASACPVCAITRHLVCAVSWAGRVVVQSAHARGETGRLGHRFSRGERNVNHVQRDDGVRAVRFVPRFRQNARDLLGLCRRTKGTIRGPRIQRAPYEEIESRGFVWVYSFPRTGRLTTCEHNTLAGSGRFGVDPLSLLLRV